MRSIPRLIDRLLQRSLRRPPADKPVSPESDRLQPLTLSEMLAASTYLDFGGVPLELWPGYRRAVATDDDRRAPVSRKNSPRLRG